MVGLAVSASLRFLRSGGVSAVIVSGMAPGFLLYVLLKVTEDLAKAWQYKFFKTPQEEDDWNAVWQPVYT